jgi:hypothetical protein
MLGFILEHLRSGRSGFPHVPTRIYVTNSYYNKIGSGDSEFKCRSIEEYKVIEQLQRLFHENEFQSGDTVFQNDWVPQGPGNIAAVLSQAGTTDDVC